MSVPVSEPKGDLRTSLEWETVFRLKVHDPDGWDRAHIVDSWAEFITEFEFARRAAQSTCSGDFGHLFTVLRGGVA